MSVSDQNTSTESETGDIDSNKRLWGPWATTGFGCGIWVVIIIAQIILVIAYTAAKAIANQPTDVAAFVDGLLEDGLLMGFSGVVTAVIGLALVAIVIKLRKSYSIKEYLGFRPISRKTILTILPIAGGFFLILYLMSFIPGRTENDLIVESYKTSVWPALFWINAVILAPVLEEIFFRGFIFVSFRRSKLKVAGTIVITSSIWTLLHIGQYDIYDLFSVFIFGLVLGMLRQKTDSLWSPVIVHSVYNLIVMILVFLVVNNIISG